MIVTELMKLELQKSNNFSINIKIETILIITLIKIVLVSSLGKNTYEKCARI